MTKKLTTVVEITDTHIKLYQGIPKKGSFSLKVFESKSIGQFSDEGITKSFAELVRAKKIIPDHFILAVPRRLTILKQMRLPSEDKEEIKKMIGLQLVTKIPYGLEDVLYDYQILAKEEDGYTKVLVIVVHKEVTERYLTVLKKIGLGSGRFTLSSFGISQWLQQYSAKAKKKKSQSSCVINIDTAHSEICFLHDQKLLFSRSINYGARDLTAENFITLSKQVKLSLESYQKERMGPPVENIYILSAIPQAVSLKERLESDLQIPIKALIPGGNVLAAKSLHPKIKAIQSELSLTVGLGLLPIDIKKTINLTPQEIYDTKQTKIFRRQLVSFIFIFLMTIVLSVTALALQLREKESYLAAAQSQLKQTTQKLEESRKQIEFVEVFSEEFKKRVLIADIVAELSNLIPEEISFRLLSIDGNNTLTVQGYSKGGIGVNDFQAALVRSKKFHNVNLQFATKRRIAKMELTDFKLTCELVGGASTKEK